MWRRLGPTSLLIYFRPFRGLIRRSNMLNCPIISLVPLNYMTDLDLNTLLHCGTRFRHHIICPWEFRITFKRKLNCFPLIPLRALCQFIFLWDCSSIRRQQASRWASGRASSGPPCSYSCCSELGPGPGPSNGSHLGPSIPNPDRPGSDREPGLVSSLLMGQPGPTR